MKRLTMMEFRRSPGERLLDVIRDGAQFLITKQGKPAARLVPVDDIIRIDSDGTVHNDPEGFLDGLRGIRDPKGRY